MHVTLRHYLLTLRGVMPGSWLLEQAHLHLLECCSACQAQWDSRPGFATAVVAPADDAKTSERRARVRPHHRHFSLGLFERETERLHRMRAMARSARRDLARLRRQPQEQWERRVANARTCFRSRAFVLLLIEEARKLVRTDPDRAAGFARLVPIALDGIDGRDGLPWVHALKARGTAHHANALRVTGDLPAADRLFAELNRSLADRPLDEPAVAAEISSLEASLRIGERRFAEAHELLARAAREYRDAGDTLGLARAWIQRGNLSWTEGEPADALRWMESAAQCLRSLDSPDPQLVIATVTGRVLALCEVERFEDAASLLSRHRGDFEAASNLHSTAIVSSMEGRIALGLGNHRSALNSHIACRDIYLDLGRYHDAALASLDIAETLLVAGKMPELRQLAADLVPLFRVRGVERETLAALRLLAEAAKTETLTAAVVAKVRRRLEPLADSAVIPSDR